METLRNARYTCLPGLGDVVLKNGTYTDPADPAASIGTDPDEPLVAFGDLNADGDDDAAIILAYSGGGSGAWIFLFAMLATDRSPKCAGAAQLGDRPDIHSLYIKDGEIVVHVGLHGPGDGMAQTSRRAKLRYRLAETGLSEQGFPPDAERYDLTLDPRAPLFGKPHKARANRTPS